MRYVLDTNIVSELRKANRTDQDVRQWFASVTSSELALSALVVGEREARP